MINKKRMILGTRKGLIVFKQDIKGKWEVSGLHFISDPISMAFVDVRNDTWWAAQDHGHWGVKLHRSVDEGSTWEEVEAPKYPEGSEIKDGEPASLKYIWSIAHGGNDHPGKLFIGTEPGGLFVSNDNGDTFELVEGLWNHPSRKDQWFGGGKDNAGIHSIIVDPDDSDHIYTGISVAGVFESKDGGNTWNPMNKGLSADFLPDPHAEIGHDPHLLVSARSDKTILWQQNHCGVFLSRDAGLNWQDVSEKTGPVGFGFAIVVDENDAETAWVVPGVSDEIRIAVDKALCVCHTSDGGRTWQSLRSGLPQTNVFDITYRHALDITGDTLAFGTTTGNLYLSGNRGDSWKLLSNNLPMIYSLYFID